MRRVPCERRFGRGDSWGDRRPFEKAIPITSGMERGSFCGGCRLEKQGFVSCALMAAPAEAQGREREERGDAGGL